MVVLVVGVGLWVSASVRCAGCVVIGLCCSCVCRYVLCSLCEDEDCEDGAEPGDFCHLCKVFVGYKGVPVADIKQTMARDNKAKHILLGEVREFKQFFLHSRERDLSGRRTIHKT